MQIVLMSMGGAPLDLQRRPAWLSSIIGFLNLSTTICFFIWLAGVLDFAGPSTQSAAGWTALATLTAGLLISVADQILDREKRDATLREVIAEMGEQLDGTRERDQELDIQLEVVEGQNVELAAIVEKLHERRISLNEVEARISQRQLQLAAITEALREQRRKAMETAAQRDALVATWAALPGQLELSKKEGRMLFVLGLLMSIPIGFAINWLS
ncbi:hypothetical protein ACQEVF_09525 [Nonomuraea polychroma]|uniref:hypothetical protein n=1 Tax=Nonomuraea polychroma TaxID=46176 RepID=UPI003D928604